MKKVHYILLILTLCISCFEEDETVTPHASGDLTVGNVKMTENYKYQVFFDLETNTSISQNLVSDWDLGFESSDSGWHIILNTSKMMLAGNTFNTEFAKVASEENIVMNFDPSDRTVDSTAIGNWYYISENIPVSHLYTFIIDRGTDENGISIGMKKIIFDVHTNGSYVIRFANLDGSDEKTDEIEKDPDKNFVCYSFDKGVVDVAPDKENWDLLFTKYSTMLDNNGEPYPYLVTGVLLNPYQVAASAGSVDMFDNITIEYAENLQLSNRKDIIGYNWKIHSFDNHRYMIDPDKVFIIKDNTGYYYILRFIDFYNSTGEKGYPAFEFIRL